MIYFVQDSLTLFIKIGFTDDSVERRIASLQTACAGTLTVLCVIDGGKRQETEIHNQFEHLHERGEWFKPSPELILFIINATRGKSYVLPSAEFDPKPAQQPTTLNPDELLSDIEAASIIGVAKETLAIWRCTKRYGLPYLKIGRLVRYRRRHIDEWIRSRQT